MSQASYGDAIEDSTVSDRKGGAADLADRGQAGAGSALGTAWLPPVVAHELRNPLSAMTHALVLLGDNNELPSQDRELLDLVLEEGRRLYRLVDRAAAAGRVRRATEAASIEALALATVSLLRLDPRVSPDVAIHLRFAPDLPAVPVDRDGIRQVLWNLLHNAVYAVGERGHVTLLADVVGTNGTARLLVEVRDDGPGIPKEVREQVFDPYFTTKPRGTGLGLAVAREIVEQHGGRLCLEDSESGGARVRFTLPLRDVQLDPEGALRK